MKIRRNKGLDLRRKKAQLKEELRQTDKDFRNWVNKASDSEIKQNLKAANEQERRDLESVLLDINFDRAMIILFRLQKEEIKETDDKKEKEHRKRIKNRRK